MKMADVKTAARLSMELSKLETAELNTVLAIAAEIRRLSAAPKVANKKQAAAPATTGKKRGRPAGTKNKPKEAAQEEAQQESLPLESEEQTH